MKFGIVVFPGSNCDFDCFDVATRVMGQQAEYIWHKDTHLKNVDAIILPGGFSYGDYLRCGAIAKFSPVMAEVKKFAAEGRPVIGICNGFQILVESGLLPGVLMRNQGLRFICRTVPLKLKTTNTLFTKKGVKDQTYQVPIAHMEGNYFIDDAGLKNLQDNDQIVFEYVDNPNGAIANIAGICNKGRNVLGMMPHPERVSEGLLGGTDGKFIFESVIGG
ncbi:phosphoribosylformylglycinamidine synthase subunit PurQ [bacterium]|nr:phosphoribosylformylglycinamidine synthase subunit PurQ [bacterium]